jgi:ABC-type glycerol-3-phosphate transport system substrate-binding protein
MIFPTIKTEYVIMDVFERFGPQSGNDEPLVRILPQKEYDATWKFIKFWMSPQQHAWWTVHSGYAPQTKAPCSSSPRRTTPPTPGSPCSIQTLNDPNTIHRPAPDNYSQVESLMTAAFFKAVEGQQPVDAALTGLQQEANKVLSGKSGF